MNKARNLTFYNAARPAAEGRGRLPGELFSGKCSSHGQQAQGLQFPYFKVEKDPEFLTPDKSQIEKDKSFMVVLKAVCENKIRFD